MSQFAANKPQNMVNFPQKSTILAGSPLKSPGHSQKNKTAINKPHKSVNQPQKSLGHSQKSTIPADKTDNLGGDSLKTGSVMEKTTKTMNPADKTDNLKKMEDELFNDYFKCKRRPSDIEKMQKEISEFKISIAKSILDIYAELDLITSKLK